MLDFVAINKDNVHWYCEFQKDFENELKYFMSRIYPNHSDFFVPMIENGLLKWSYLFYGGRIIGAIWLEKEQSTLRTATLGVFIAEKDMRSRGIGERAINRFIQANQKAMNLVEITLDVRKENIRAIKCYEKCGFVCEQEYEKADGTKMMRMINDL